MREFAKEFYQSQAWKQCRAAYLRKVSGLCENCLKRGLYTPADTVHHIVHLSPANIGDPDVSLNDANLMAVCRDCHAELHRQTKRYKVGADGKIFIPLTSPQWEASQAP